MDFTQSYQDGRKASRIKRILTRLGRKTGRAAGTATVAGATGFGAMKVAQSLKKRRQEDYTDPEVTWKAITRLLARKASRPVIMAGRAGKRGAMSLAKGAGVAGSLATGAAVADEVERKKRIARTYEHSPELAHLQAATYGISLLECLELYSKLTGFQLGVKHGREEAEGKRGAPGAFKLAIMKKLHGGEYILGRQHALTIKRKHGGTTSGAGTLSALGGTIEAALKGQIGQSK